MKKLFQNLLEKEEIERLLLGPNKLNPLFLFLLFLFLPTQLGLHFWPSFAFVNGVRVDYLSPTAYVLDVLIIILLFLNKRYFFAKKNLAIFLIVFIFIFVPGVLISESKGAFFYGSLKLTEMILLTSVLIKQLKINLPTISIALSFGIIFESLLSALQLLNQGSINGIFYFFGERFYSSSTPGIANASLNGELFLRPYGTFSHPNVLAGYLLISMVFISIFIFSKTVLRRNFFIISIFIGTCILILTLSRVAIIVWIFYCIIFLIKHADKKMKVILGTLLLLVVIIFFSTILKYRIFLSSIDDSVFQRVGLYKGTLRMISENIFFGVGINNYYSNIIKFIPKSSFFGYAQPVHNIFLLVFAESGIMGLSLFLLPFIKFFKTNIYEIKFLSLSVILLGAFDHYFLTIQQGEILLCFVLALGLAKISRKEIDKMIKSNDGSQKNRDKHHLPSNK